MFAQLLQLRPPGVLFAGVGERLHEAGADEQVVHDRPVTVPKIPDGQGPPRRLNAPRLLHQPVQVAVIDAVHLRQYLPGRLGGDLVNALRNGFVVQERGRSGGLPAVAQRHQVGRGACR